MGGPLATSSPEMCFNEAPVDYIVMGMGEKTAVKLAENLKNNKKITTIPSVSYKINKNVKIKDIYVFNDNLDSWNFPSLNLWRKGIEKLGMIPILSSRGCPYNCSFCYNNSFIAKKKWYPRSADHVIKEMDYWSKYFNINNFYFVDDNMLLDSKRACIILKTATSRGYKINQVIGNINDYKSELIKVLLKHHLQLGFAIESASPKIQKLLNKIIDVKKITLFIKELTKNKISQITTNFMFGVPSETDEDIKANIDLAYKLRTINNKIRIIPYIYTPQPKDNIISKFDFKNDIQFTLKTLSTIDMAPNRSNYLSHEIRPWMSPEDISFYLDLVLVWFYHFDYIVRGLQDININNILEKKPRLKQLFVDIPLPEIVIT